MNSIVVFCGSSEGYNEQYREAAWQLGAVLATRSINVVYGGARIGLMGAIADSTLENGGTVTGVIPVFLQTKEITHQGLTRLVTVNTMHERKLLMHELSDGIIALPGGWGTMEELFEMLTWGQLGLHGKPVGLLNINGYYDALIALCDNMVAEGFLGEFVRASLLTSPDIDELLQMMDAYTPPPAPQWLTEQTT